MNKLIVIFTLLSCSLSFADKIVVDTTMAADRHSKHNVFEDRGSFGPYVEFSNIKMKDVDYVYKIHDKRYNISMDNSYLYGASGSLPLTEWFDIYLIAGYQYLGISHHPQDSKDVYADMEQMADDFFEAPYDSSDVDGRHQVHTALFQLGFDLALPLFTNYKHQFMIKPYAFGGVLFGKTFFSDDTQFLSPVVYGYAYGAGLRLAWHSFTLSGGFRNAHEYFHTYFEKKTGDKKEGDEFMLDFNTYFRPFVNIGITLF